ncbi:pyrophosphate--fructose 6-phosphate 1-phosphotransferase subunit alpha [Tanacetum coccineum]
MPRRSILSFSDFSPAIYVAGEKRAGERGFCCSGLDWCSVVDSLREGTMLFGAFMKLSKFTTPKALCLAFWVNATMAACNALKLDGLVIVGGVTSNSDAAQLAETFAALQRLRFTMLHVVGVPVTLNGDLKNQFVEANVGFDTICKVNFQLISNVCTDALSAEKYYYFIRLMGRKASHVALECTLQSHPNMVILGEEVAASKLTIFELTKRICDAVQARAEQEGLIESVPEFYALLQEIHSLLREGVSADNISFQLSPWASALFEFLPPFIRKQLLLNPEFLPPFIRF